MVEIEMLIPGLCTMDVKIPAECTISALKTVLVDHANEHLLSFFEKQCTIDKSWMTLAMFGYEDRYDIPLEEEAISRLIQIERMRKMFNLTVTRRKIEKAEHKKRQTLQSDSNSSIGSSYEDEWVVQWNERCRLALFIFSVTTRQTYPNNKVIAQQEPWTFVHEERPGAPATYLENTLTGNHLRAWDFVSGKAYSSCNPIVFSYGEVLDNGGRIDRRAFMKVSTSANEPQQYHEPGQILVNGGGDDTGPCGDDNSGYILGMGENAIVHRVRLIRTSSGKKPVVEVIPTDDAAAMMMVVVDEPQEGSPSQKLHAGAAAAPAVSPGFASAASSIGGDLDEDDDVDELVDRGWDAAVKRPYTLPKMLASLQSPSSEVGLAKRLRFANGLNSDGRIVEFYGLGIAFACNANNPSQFKYELVLLSRTFGLSVLCVCVCVCAGYYWRNHPTCQAKKRFRSDQGQ